MYSVETCGVCVHECKCAYEYPCSDCNVLRSYCKENHFEEAEKDADDLFQDIDFSVVGKCENFDMNRYELMGYSHEVSILLQDCYESTKALWECFADADAAKRL